MVTIIWYRAAARCRQIDWSSQLVSSPMTTRLTSATSVGSTRRNPSSTVCWDKPVSVVSTVKCARAGRDLLCLERTMAVMSSLTLSTSKTLKPGGFADCELLVYVAFLISEHQFWLSHACAHTHTIIYMHTCSVWWQFSINLSVTYFELCIVCLSADNQLVNGQIPINFSDYWSLCYILTVYAAESACKPKDPISI